MKSEWRLFGEKLWFQAIKMVYLKTKLPPITCRGDQKWTKIWPQKPKIGSNWTLLGALKATPKRRRFERVLTLIPKVGPKLTQKWSKEVKNDQIWVKNDQIWVKFGFRGQGWGFLGQKDGRHAKNEPKAIFGVWKLVLTRIFSKRSGRLPEIRNFRVWSERGEEENLEGWFFVTKMKNQYENFWWTKLGKMKIM